jgi:hypothetical protein
VRGKVKAAPKRSERMETPPEGYFQNGPGSRDQEPKSITDRLGSAIITIQNFKAYQALKYHAFRCNAARQQQATSTNPVLMN